MTHPTYAALLTHAAMSSCLEPSPCEEGCPCIPCAARRSPSPRPGATKRQVALHAFMWQHRDAEGVWPTMMECAAATGVSRPTISERLRAMERRGLVVQGAKNTERSWGCVERVL